jgi:hypothetical protein
MITILGGDRTSYPYQTGAGSWAAPGWGACSRSSWSPPRSGCWLLQAGNTSKNGPNDAYSVASGNQRAGRGVSDT